MLKFLPDILITIIIATYLLIYLRGIKSGRVKPTLSTWIFFAFAGILSLVTDFRETGVHGLFANSYNILDTSGVFITLAFIFLFQKDINKKFNKLERNCLIAVIIVGILWLISGQNILAHLSVQIIMFISYIPMFAHLWKAKENTESLGMWSLDSVASVLGSINPILNGDLLPIAYGLRSAICTFSTVLLILRIKYKAKKGSVLPMNSKPISS